MRPEILIVEDCEVQREALRHLLLLKLDRITVTTAKDGEDALATLRSRGEQIGVMTLDIGMPGMDGKQLLQALVEEHRSPLAVVVITGYADSKLATELLQTCSEWVIVTDYLIKPTAWARLLGSIGDALDNRNKTFPGTTYRKVERESS